MLLAGIAIVGLLALSRLLTWLLVAGFLAVALNPAVDLFVRRLRMRRGVATGVVLLLGVVVLTGIVFMFVRPLTEQGTQLADDLPKYIDDVKAGRGPVGGLLDRYGLDEKLREQSDSISANIGQLGARSVKVLGMIGTALVATLTVFVLTFMILLEGDKILTGALALVPERHREHVARVAHDCASAVTGYVTGNLLISVIAGGTSFVMMLATGIPFAGLLALLVGITDLIPLVGAVIGAVVVVIVAFTVSPTVGIVALVFFVVYQQVENHLLQPAVQARTVRLNPLTVLVAALAGVELAGLLGALLAIPVAGIITVLLRDIHLGMRPEMRGVTVGEDEVPVSLAEDPDSFLERTENGQVVTPEERARSVQLTGDDPGTE
ncbi:MAG TPA: AI-2E family transporter [Microthrixaceae bacterium]|nr:AI-2E family transporter [Microthrixaceae bacterium]